MCCTAYHCDADQFQPETGKYISPVLLTDIEGVLEEWRPVVQGDTNLLDTQCFTASTATRNRSRTLQRLDYFLTDEGRVSWQDAVIQ